MTRRIGRMMRGGAAALALAAAFAAAPAAVSAQALTADEEAYRAAARANARTLGQAYRHMERYILDVSPAATVWTGSLPPAATGWRAAWTARGIRSRYCDDTLLVYYGIANLAGTGADQRAVQAAPVAYAAPGRQGTPLHWLDGGAVEISFQGSVDTLPMPVCMTPGSLPAGRAALAGEVLDPFTNTHNTLTREISPAAANPCPAGKHGAGIVRIREVTQVEDGRGNPVGSPVAGAWAVMADQCADDYTAWEQIQQACSWYAGAPHNRTMHGADIWRRLKSVSGPMLANGEPTVAFGALQFVSTSCWGSGATPPPPSPNVTLLYSSEEQPWSCPAGYLGDATRSRTITERRVRWPWDSTSTIGFHFASWVPDQSNCVQPARPPEDEECTWNAAGYWDCVACGECPPGGVGPFHPLFAPNCDNGGGHE